MEIHLNLLKKYKKICIRGNIGTDHFLYAKILAKNLLGEDFNSNIHIIQFNENSVYENIIYGTTVYTEQSNSKINGEEKILIQIIRHALNTNNPIVIILKDINLVNLFNVFGDAIGLIKGEKEVYLNNSLPLPVPNNIYWIATETPLYSMHMFLHSNYLNFYYIDLMENAVSVNSELTTLDEIKAFFDIRLTTKVQIENLKNCYQAFKLVNKTIIDSYFMLLDVDKPNYYIGRNYFYDKNIRQKMKDNLLFILVQYVKQGILSMSAFSEINHLLSFDIVSTQYNSLEDLDISIMPSNENKYSARISTMNMPYTKHFSNYYLKHTGQINLNDNQVLSIKNSTELPFCLIVQLCELNLISNREMFSHIIYNPHLYTYPNDICKNAYLFSDFEKHMHTASNGKDKIVNVYRNRYGVLIINEIKYGIFHHLAIHNGKVNFSDGHISSENRRYLPINTVIYYILKYYYNCYVENLRALHDDNSKKLVAYVEDEINQFEQHVRQINETNLGQKFKDNQLNSYLFELLKYINDDLKILKMKIGDEILYNGEKIILRGAYRVENKTYLDIMNTLGIHQMILQGPPGTSKTYTTEQIIKSCLEPLVTENLNIDQLYMESQFSKVLELDPNQDFKLQNQGVIWDIVQFHPSYTYEDFIRGIRVETVNGYPSYTTANKILGEMAAYAYHNKETKFFLIVDEINRANLATVFGELIYGLEYRDKSVTTPYKVEDNYGISLPHNLYIIGTVNTADKSVGSIDYAIRRRFLFFNLLPDAKVLQDEYKDLLGEGVTNSLKLYEALVRFFKKYHSTEYNLSDVQIGHTYFLTRSLLKDLVVDGIQPDQLQEKIDDILKIRFEYQIVPILREYVKDGILQNHKNSDEDQAYQQLFKLLKFEQEIEIKDVYKLLLGNEEGA